MGLSQSSFGMHRPASACVLRRSHTLPVTSSDLPRIFLRHFVLQSQLQSVSQSTDTRRVCAPIRRGQIPSWDAPLKRNLLVRGCVHADSCSQILFWSVCRDRSSCMFSISPKSISATLRHTIIAKKTYVHLNVKHVALKTSCQLNSSLCSHVSKISSRKT